MILLNRKKTEHFRLCLNKLLICGRPSDFIALETSEGELHLSANLIHANDVEKENKKNNWDIDSVLGRAPNDVTMLIVDQKNRELMAVFERGEKIPEPVFHGIKGYYKNTLRINVDGSRHIFGNWNDALRIAVILSFLAFFLLGGLAQL